MSAREQEARNLILRAITARRSISPKGSHGAANANAEILVDVATALLLNKPKETILFELIFTRGYVESTSERYLKGGEILLSELCRVDKDVQTLHRLTRNVSPKKKSLKQQAALFEASTMEAREPSTDTDAGAKEG
jgi:hypothetical protein